MIIILMKCDDYREFSEMITVQIQLGEVKEQHPHAAVDIAPTLVDSTVKTTSNAKQNCPVV